MGLGERNKKKDNQAL